MEAFSFRQMWPVHMHLPHLHFTKTTFLTGKKKKTLLQTLTAWKCLSEKKPLLLPDLAETTSPQTERLCIKQANVVVSAGTRSSKEEQSVSHCDVHKQNYEWWAKNKPLSNIVVFLLLTEEHIPPGVLIPAYLELGSTFSHEKGAEASSNLMALQLQHGIQAC